jgi:hypothetical protein
MDDNLENMLNEVPWLRPEPIVIDHAKIEPAVTGSNKKRFFSKTGNKIGLAITLAGLSLFGAGCKSSTGPTPPEKTYQLSFQVDAYYDTGAKATGTVEVSMQGQTYTGNIGDKILCYKGKIKESMGEVLIKAAHSKNKRMKGLVIRNTGIETAVADTNSLDWAYMTGTVLLNSGINFSWDQPKFEVVFNSTDSDPNKPQLPQNYKDAIMQAYADAKAASANYKGVQFIQSIPAPVIDHKVYNVDWPSNGQIYVFTDLTLGGAGITGKELPSLARKVSSAAIVVNSKIVGPVDAYREAYNILVQGDQPIGGDPHTPAAVAFMLNHTRGDTNSSQLTADEEIQTGLSPFDKLLYDNEPTPVYNSEDTMSTFSTGTTIVGTDLTQPPQPRYNSNDTIQKPAQQNKTDSNRKKF